MCMLLPKLKIMYLQSTLFMMKCHSINNSIREASCTLLPEAILMETTNIPLTSLFYRHLSVQRKAKCRLKTKMKVPPVTKIMGVSLFRNLKPKQMLLTPFTIIIINRSRTISLVSFHTMGLIYHKLLQQLQVALIQITIKVAVLQVLQLIQLFSIKDLLAKVGWRTRG